MSAPKSYHPVKRCKLDDSVVLRGFDKVTDDHNLREYVLRVTAFHPYDKVTPPYEALNVYREMLTKMTVPEQKRMFNALCDVYIHLLTRNGDYIVTMEQLYFTYQKLIQATKRYGNDSARYCVFLMQKCLDKLDSHPEYVLDMASPDDTDYILMCCSLERFDLSWIRSSDILMQDLENMKPKRFVPFLKYGFSYSFFFPYYRNCAYTLLNNLQVKGKPLDFAISYDILLGQQNLRLQMAVELLAVHFYRTEQLKQFSTSKSNLRLLWNLVPYPFISEAEMFTLLDPFFVGEKKLLEEVCSEYAKRNSAFKVPKVKEPRLLKHLARVQVRENLTEANTISEKAIDCLEVPETLKGYLKLNSLSKKSVKTGLNYHCELLRKQYFGN